MAVLVGSGDAGTESVALSSRDAAASAADAAAAAAGTAPASTAGAEDRTATPPRLATGDGAPSGTPACVALSAHKSAAGAAVLAASAIAVVTGVEVGWLGDAVAELGAAGATARDSVVAITSYTRAAEQPNWEVHSRLYVHNVLYDIGHQETPSCHFIVLWPAHAAKGQLP